MPADAEGPTETGRKWEEAAGDTVGFAGGEAGTATHPPETHCRPRNTRGGTPGIQGATTRSYRFFLWTVSGLPVTQGYTCCPPKKLSSHVLSLKQQNSMPLSLTNFAPPPPPQPQMEARPSTCWLSMLLDSQCSESKPLSLVTAFSAVMGTRHPSQEFLLESPEGSASNRQSVETSRDWPRGFT